MTASSLCIESSSCAVAVAGQGAGQAGQIWAGWVMVLRLLRSGFKPGSCEWVDCIS